MQLCCEHLIFGKFIVNGVDVSGYTVVSRSSGISSTQGSKLQPIASIGQISDWSHFQPIYALTNVPSDNRQIFSCTIKSSTVDSRRAPFTLQHAVLIPTDDFATYSVSNLVAFLSKLQIDRQYESEEISDALYLDKGNLSLYLNSPVDWSRLQNTGNLLLLLDSLFTSSSTIIITGKNSDLSNQLIILDALRSLLPPILRQALSFQTEFLYGGAPTKLKFSSSSMIQIGTQDFKLPWPTSVTSEDVLKRVYQTGFVNFISEVLAGGDLTLSEIAGLCQELSDAEAQFDLNSASILETRLREKLEWPLIYGAFEANDQGRINRFQPERILVQLNIYLEELSSDLAERFFRHLIDRFLVRSLPTLGRILSRATLSSRFWDTQFKAFCQFASKSKVIEFFETIPLSYYRQMQLSNGSELVSEWVSILIDQKDLTSLRQVLGSPIAESLLESLIDRIKQELIKDNPDRGQALLVLLEEALRSDALAKVLSRGILGIFVGKYPTVVSILQKVIYEADDLVPVRQLDHPSFYDEIRTQPRIGILTGLIAVKLGLINLLTANYLLLLNDHRYSNYQQQLFQLLGNVQTGLQHLSEYDRGALGALSLRLKYPFPSKLNPTPDYIRGFDLITSTSNEAIVYYNDLINAVSGYEPSQRQVELFSQVAGLTASAKVGEYFLLRAVEAVSNPDASGKLFETIAYDLLELARSKYSNLSNRIESNLSQAYIHAQFERNQPITEIIADLLQADISFDAIINTLSSFLNRYDLESRVDIWFIIFTTYDEFLRENKQVLHKTVYELSLVVSGLSNEQLNTVVASIQTQSLSESVKEAFYLELLRRAAIDSPEAFVNLLANLGMQFPDTTLVKVVFDSWYSDSTSHYVSHFLEVLRHHGYISLADILVDRIISGELMDNDTLSLQLFTKELEAAFFHLKRVSDWSRKLGSRYLRVTSEEALALSISLEKFKANFSGSVKAIFNPTDIRSNLETLETQLKQVGKAKRKGSGKSSNK